MNKYSVPLRVPLYFEGPFKLLILVPKGRLELPTYALRMLVALRNKGFSGVLTPFLVPLGTVCATAVPLPLLPP